MTPEEHQQRIARLRFDLQKAHHGLAMPYDYQRVLILRQLIMEAELQAQIELMTSDGAK